MKVVFCILFIIVIVAFLTQCAWLMLYSGRADYYPDIKDL